MRNSPIWMLVTTSIYGMGVYPAILNKPELASTSEHPLPTSLPVGLETAPAYRSPEESSPLLTHQNPLTESNSDIQSSTSHATHALSDVQSDVLMPLYQVGRPFLQLPSPPEPDIHLPVYQHGPTPVLHPTAPEVIPATFHPISSFVTPTTHTIPRHHVLEAPIAEDWSNPLHLGYQQSFAHQLQSIYHIPDVSSTFISPYQPISFYQPMSPYQPVLPYPQIPPYPHSPYPHSFGLQSSYPQSSYSYSSYPLSSYLHSSYPHVFYPDSSYPYMVPYNHPVTSSRAIHPMHSFSTPHISPFDFNKHSIYPPIEGTYTNFYHSLPFTLSSAPLVNPASHSATQSPQGTTFFHAGPQRFDNDFLMRSEKKNVSPIQTTKSSNTSGNSRSETLHTSSQKKMLKKPGVSDPSGSSSSRQVENQPMTVQRSIQKTRWKKPWKPKPNGMSATKLVKEKENLAMTPINSVLEDGSGERKGLPGEKILIGQHQVNIDSPQSNTLTTIPDLAPPDSQGLDKTTSGSHEEHLLQHLVASKASSHGDKTEFEREPKLAQATSSDAELQDLPSVFENTPVLDFKDSKLFPALKDTINSAKTLTTPLPSYKNSRPSSTNSKGEELSAVGPSSSNFVADTRNPDRMKKITTSLASPTLLGQEFIQPKKMESVRNGITTYEDRRADTVAAFDNLRVQLKRLTKHKDSGEQMSISEAPLHSPIKPSIESFDNSRPSEIAPFPGSGSSTQEKSKASASNSNNDGITQWRVSKAPKVDIPEDLSTSQKKSSRLLLEDLNLADPKLLSQNKKVESKFGPSNTRAITGSKGRDVKPDNQAPSSIEPPPVGRNFWSNVAPIISCLQVKTPFQFSAFLPSPTSRFLEWLKALSPRIWMGKNELAKDQSQMAAEASEDISKTKIEESHDSEGATGDGESVGSIPSSTRVQTHPSRRKRKKNLPIPASATSADKNEVGFHEELLKDSALHAISRILQINDNHDLLQIDLELMDYETLRARDDTDWVSILSWTKMHSEASEKEMDRRVQVLINQLNHYEILGKYHRAKKHLDSATIKRWETLFRIDELCPTLSHIDKSNNIEVKTTLDGVLLSIGEKEALTEVLGELELKQRIGLIDYMRQRDSTDRWWREDELQDARWQGHNVLDILQIGDLLQLGMTHNIAAVAPKATLMSLYERMHSRNKYPELYPIHATSWGESPEREWFHQNPTLWHKYQSRMRDLILKADFAILGESSLLKNLDLPPVSPWWSLGDLLMWSDEGVPLKKMAKVASKVGKDLHLTNFKQLTPNALEQLNWKHVFKGIDSDTKFKAKMCLETRAKWNIEENTSIFSSLMNKLTGKLFSN
ncbi:uncharacterized protein MELLADRAFT_60868 [Melampsora larici-populina 98AG31]|uniref:Uncharacterized protein n=1 Tax=Melampsora larici-populina (strain 98AG31 / pathotype 3-4-7) TaxID=747676 RepID=F4RCR6_MELLP|nr:uncharacterized protein MELLADRAFT_60868 [Melampsora larici-populina 98AG31]EGG09937.1 hypothetical protein MELLADRAFT_60868 [Melampsora larici-populina 98AG31]